MSRSSRRATLGLGSTTKLNRRLKLRKIFDALDKDSSGGVSVTELNEGVESSPELKNFFDSVSTETNQSLFAAMDADNDGAVTWDEFMEFVNESERRSERGLPASYKFAAKYKPGKLVRLSAQENLAVPTEKRAAQLLVDGTEPRLNVMDFDDPRVVVVRPDALVVVESGTIESEILARADDLVRNNHVQERHSTDFANQLRAAAVEACRTELENIERVDKRMAARFGELAITVVQCEDEFMRASEQARRVRLEAHAEAETSKLSVKNSTLDEAGQVDELVAQLETEGCTSTARLARRLADLQNQLARCSQAFGAPPRDDELGSDEFARVDSNGDGVLSRQEWALWYRKKMEIMRAANAQRQQLIKDNNRLRKALSQKADSTFRDKIKLRDRLNDELLKLRLENDNLRHEIELIDSEATDLSADVELMEHERANSLRISVDGADVQEGYDLPSQERQLILKNWADEKEGVLTIHERARQEWELERASLVAQAQAKETERARAEPQDG